MAIKIQEKKTEIPVEIGDLTFSFKVTDESLVSFRKNAINAENELNDLKIGEDEDDEQILGKARDVLEKSFDFILGDDAFKKIYEITPSVPYLTDYFIQLVEGLSEELEQLGANSERAKKYIKKNKK